MVRRWARSRLSQLRAHGSATLVPPLESYCSWKPSARGAHTCVPWQNVGLGCTMWRSQCLICSQRSPWVAGSSMRSAQNPSHEGLAGSSVAGSPHCSSSPKILEGANLAKLPPRSLRGSVYLSPLSWRRQSISLLRVACVRKLSAGRCN